MQVNFFKQIFLKNILTNILTKKNGELGWAFGAILIPE